jgi:hypothetical protein
VLFVLAATQCHAKDKKPRAPEPSTCTTTALFCFTSLDWVDSKSTVYGIFENRSTVPVSSLTFTFAMTRTDNGLIVGSAIGSLSVVVPPGGKAEVAAMVITVEKYTYGFVINSVNVQAIILVNQQPALREGNVAVYPPLFNNIWARHAWNKANGY